jgi:hypothetical protein
MRRVPCGGYQIQRCAFFLDASFGSSGFSALAFPPFAF